MKKKKSNEEVRIKGDKEFHNRDISERGRNRHAFYVNLLQNTYA